MTGEKVLIIDDSDALRSLLESILPYAGYQAVSASTGRQGLQLVSEEKPDLVLTDLELPDTSGLKLLEELKQRGIAIPTIMMTGYGSEGIAARALQLGVRDYLIKPFTTEEVLASIERALSESRLRRENLRLTTVVDEYKRHFRLLLAISREASSSPNVEQFLQRIVEAGRFAAGAEVALLFLLEDETAQLHVAALDGRAAHTSDLCPAEAGNECLQAVLRNDTAVRLHSDSNPAIQLQTGDKVKSVLQVPIKVKGKTCGLLSVDRRIASTAFDKHDELLLLILADYVSLVLQRADSVPLKASARPAS